MLRLALLVAVFLTGPVLAADPIDISAPGMLEWSGDDSGQVYVAGDLTMTLTVTGDESERTATLRVEKPGAKPVELSGLGSGTGYGEVGVYPFDDNGGRSVIFAVYAGGAHCCMQIVTATEVAGGFVTDDVDSIDGDHVPLEDLDGDGIYEMPVFDGRFNYAFDAYAFSFPPQLVYKSRDGVSYDASGDPRWRTFYESQLDEMRLSCSGDTWDLGVCAGLLGVAARLGTYETELAAVKAALDAGKRTSGWEDFNICLDPSCETWEEVPDFIAAIDRQLRDWSYLPPR